MHNILISSPNNHDATVYLPVIHGILKNYYYNNGKYFDQFNWLPPIYKKEYSLPEEQIDILGISCYVWNAGINYEIAKTVKEKNPNCIVIAGGPEVDYKNKDFFILHPYIDIIAIQDGELTFTEILDKIANNNLNFDDILGVITKTNQRFSLPIKPKSFSGVISDITITDFNKVCEDERKLNHKIAYTLETDRGCPYGCTFCDWGSNTMNKIRKIDLSSVYEEIEWVGKNEINAMFIANANFGIFPRDIDIANKIAEVKRKYGYPKIIQTNYTKTHSTYINEIIKIFNSVDLIDSFALAVQSTSAQTLSTSERTNLPDRDLRKIIDLCDSLNLPVRPQIILGMPGETLDSFKQTFEDLMNMGIYDNFCIFPFEMLVNAPANEKEYIEKHGLVTKKLYSRTYHNPKSSTKRTLSSYLVETNTYSMKDYTEMLFFSTVIMVFVCMGFSRLPIRYLSKNLKHTEIIDRLISYFLNKKDDTVIGNILHTVKQKYEEIATLGKNGFPDFEVPFLEHYMDADEYIMSKMYMGDIDKCFTELEQFYQTIDNSEKFLDLCNYQREIIISPSFNPEVKKIKTFKYDWTMSLDPEPSDIVLEYQDTIIGSSFKKNIVWHKYPNKTTVFLMQTLVVPVWRSNILFHKNIHKYNTNTEK